MKRPALALVLLLLGLAAWGQPLEYAVNSAVVEWDAPTTMDNGTPIPAGEVVSYEYGIAPLSSRAVFVVQGTGTATQGTVTAPAEGSWLVGVRTVRVVGEYRALSPILWSDDPANPEGGFVIVYAAAYGSPAAMRFRL